MNHRPLRRKLSPRELAKAATLLERVTPVPFMEEGAFKALWKARLMPMIALEFLIFEENPFAGANARTLPRVLLSYREDEYYKAWHVPGGFLGAKETFMRAIKRILRRELGILPKKIQPLFLLNHPHGLRDHHVSVFLAVKLAEKPWIQKDVLEYFSPSRLPSNLIPYYRKAFLVLKKIHTFSKSLQPNKRHKFFETLNVCEISGR